MFCPSCGYKNDDDARFCDQCGKELPLTLSKKEPTPKGWSPEPITITIGIFTIASVYLVPIIPFSYFGYEKTITLAQLTELCNQPLASCHGTFESLPFFFYIGWLLGIGLICMGLFIGRSPE